MQTSHQIEWNSDWIGLLPGTIPPGEQCALLARYLRREFSVSKPLKRASARFCGLGVFDFSINSLALDGRLHAPGYTYQKNLLSRNADLFGRPRAPGPAPSVWSGSAGNDAALSHGIFTVNKFPCSFPFCACKSQSVLPLFVGCFYLLTHPC
jgi:hypothetical protein